jgi:hypothetical protein
MSDRFKDGASGDLARLLFESADDDAPPPGAHGRALAALGVGSAVAASSSAAAAATAAPKAATVVTGAAIAKWLALGAGAAFLTVGTGAVVARQVFAPQESTTVVVTQGAPPQAPPAPPPRSAISELPAVTPKALAPAPPAEAIPLESLPRVSPAPLQNTPPAAGRRGDAPSTSDLAMEVESLDRVRAALASANAGAALRELDAFSVRFPAAALAPEATVLRVQALLESGNRAAAERLARRFIAASPGSPHAARIRLLIEGSARPKARFD